MSDELQNGHCRKVETRLVLRFACAIFRQEIVGLLFLVHKAERATYFACTLEVIEVTTFEAILNCSTRSVMPWRCAIHWKSV